MPPKPRKGFIHPHDPFTRSRSKSKTTTWSRLKDCFTGHGPDIFVGTINPPHKLSRNIWSNWGVVLDPDGGGSAGGGRRCPRNVDDGGDGEGRRKSVYNFRTRKYEMWREGAWDGGGMWSDVGVCGDRRCGEVVWVRDAWGRIVDLSWGECR